MSTLALLAALLSLQNLALAAEAEIASLYNQCGGENWEGATQCASGAYCQSQNPYYYQCVATSFGYYTNTSISSTATYPSSSITVSPTSSVVPTGLVSPLYGQCGGQNWNGATSCAKGSYCKYLNNYYFQCVPEADGNPAEISTFYENGETIVTAIEAPTWAQCGGHGYYGPSKCQVGTSCRELNAWYYQCIPDDHTEASTTTLDPTSSFVSTTSLSTLPASSETTIIIPTSTAVEKVPLWGQCGGIGYTGSTICDQGSCIYLNDWYYQCLISDQGATTSTSLSITSSSESSTSESSSVGPTSIAIETVPLWGQCGGIGYTGSTICDQGSCIYLNDWYYQCLIRDEGTTSSTSLTVTSTSESSTPESSSLESSTSESSTSETSTSESSTSESSSADPTPTAVADVPLWGQCGGIGYTGSTTCSQGTCVYLNDWYFQCVPEEITFSSTSSSSSSSTSSSTGSSSIPTSTSSSGDFETIPGGFSGTGRTTRYWDCCKPSCSWPGKSSSVTGPVRSCGVSGSVLDPNTQSGCIGGEAFTCDEQQPWSINDDLAYGFAAASLAGGSEDSSCCTCMKLTFTSSSIAGKTMIVQLTNTGSDLGSNHFDIALPGGGLGIFTEGCSSQFGSGYQWGNQYGGIFSLAECDNLPSELQPGCQFRFGWFENADNPSVEFEQVSCPPEITSITGCARTDE